MPRLLLVDDNPSIHKIAETLLGSSSIELVCVGSASEALMMLDSGERFDVALLDTAMPGMDGWELLARMRKHPDSAFIPIAMMAGVLDTVDPEKLKHAPIQGFIKKPIELRELAERVQHLLATPVTLAESEGMEGDPKVLSPFATVPGTKFKSLPEFRGVVDGPPPEEIQARGILQLDDTNDVDGQDDLLLLTPEDFWFEEATVEPDSDDFLLAQATAQAMVEAQVETPVLHMAPVGSVDTLNAGDSTLDLEELDLEALKELPNEEPPILPEVPEASGIPEISEPQEPQEPQEPEEPFGEMTVGSAIHAQPELAIEASVQTSELLGEPYEEETLAIPDLAIRVQALSAQESIPTSFPVHEFLTEDITAQSLSDLGEGPDFEDLAPEIPPPEAPAPPIFEEVASHVEPHEESSFPSVAAYALPTALAIPAVSAFQSAMHEPSVPSVPSVPLAALVPIAPPTTAPESQSLASGGEAPRDAAALIQILMSDPVLMDALTKAVVAKLGDQALREIAWELMPELAEKLPR